MPFALAPFADDVLHRAGRASTGFDATLPLFHAVPSATFTAIRAASLPISTSRWDGSAALHRTSIKADV